MEQTGVSGRKEQKNAWQPTQPEAMMSLLAGIISGLFARPMRVNMKIAAVNAMPHFSLSRTLQQMCPVYAFILQSLDTGIVPLL